MWDGTDRREGQRWRIKREISIGDIFAFFTAVIAVVTAYTTLDKRIQRLEDAAVVQRDVDRRQDDEQLRSQGRIEGAIKTLDDKIDRVLERVRRIPP